MHQSESQHATERVARLKAGLNVDVLSDWGGNDSDWNPGTWTLAELDRLNDALGLLTQAMGGSETFARNLGGVKVLKGDLGSHGGEALAHEVRLSSKHSFSAWTVIHEFAHAWDANHGWQLSVALEQYTGGFTHKFLGKVKRFLLLGDANVKGSEDAPGKRGRKPGCNAAGYFYGDQPSGANWAFNRVEDFAESVAMYIGWKGNNPLSDHAHKRITRYELANGEKDPLFGAKEYWADYATYFYPPNGDYTSTLRWQFVDVLMKGKIEVAGKV